MGAFLGTPAPHSNTTQGAGAAGSGPACPDLSTCIYVSTLGARRLWAGGGWKEERERGGGGGGGGEEEEEVSKDFGHKARPLFQRACLARLALYRAGILGGGGVVPPWPWAQVQAGGMAWEGGA